jgi:hypothetical protein
MRNILIIAAFLQVFALSAQVFQRPFENAQSMALGGAMIANPALDVGISNEALLGRSDKKGGVYLGTALPYSIGGWQVAQIQGFMRIGKNNGVGLDLQNSSIEGYGEQRFRLQYGRRLGKKFFLGGGIDMLRQWATEYESHQGFSVSIGLFAEAAKNLFISARISNPVQQKIGTEVLPSTLRIGFAWLPSSQLAVLGETEKDLQGKALVKFGLDYKVHTMLSVRLGMRTTPLRACFGAGLHLKNGLGLDFGSEWHPVLGVTPAAGAKWLF